MYVVVGPSGRTGRVVVASLLERGLPVRVVVRSPERGAPWADRCEVAVADLRDASALGEAFAGASSAYVLIPDALHEPRFAAWQDAVASAIASAAEASGLPHGVLLSALDADEPGRGPPSGLGRAERRLAAGRTKWAFLRAASFLDNVAAAFGTLDQGFIGSFYPSALPIDMVPTRDVGLAAADLLVRGATGIVELTGAAVAMDDVAASLTRVLGRPIRVERAPLEAVVPMFTGLGASEDAALHVRALFDAQIRGRVHSGSGPGPSLDDALRGLLGAPA